MTARSGKLVAEIVALPALCAGDRNRMWEIFEKYYSDVTRTMFDNDLSCKQHVILVRDSGEGSVQGFSTLQLMEAEVEKRKVTAIFSGDTVIEKEYWGQTALQKAFFRYIVSVKLSHPFSAVYWFLISKGYKTYLLLSRNFPEHWPRYEREIPSWQRSVLDTLARRKFGDAWKPERGILQFTTCLGKLKCDVAAVEQELLRFPDIRFFHERNPGHSEGEELCCLGRINLHLALSYPMKLASKLINPRKRRKKKAML